MKLKSVLVPAMLAVSSLALGLVTAQTPNISLYGGVYLPTQNVTPSIDVPKSGVVQFRLERVLEPATLEKFKYRAETDPAGARDIYLINKASRMHVFRQRIPIRPADVQRGVEP